MSSPDGLLIVDKPAGWTSHDVVGRARRLCRTRKVGHAGTLDPMATGVLVIGVGRATKLLTFLVGCDKTYTATFRLGQATVTDDAEGDLTACEGATGVTRAAVQRAVAGLTGDILQVPSAVSAIKVDGVRSYHRVRAGEGVDLPPRPVRVDRFEVLDVRAAVSVAEQPTNGLPGSGEAATTDVLDVDVVVDVSSGTYVRALARDLGATLGCGGHLTALRRTRVGGYGLDVARPLEALTAEAEAVEAGVATIPMAEAARAAFPVRTASEAEVRTLVYGQPLASAEPGRVGPVAVIAPDGMLVAMVDETRSRAKSLVVFPPA